MRVFPWAPPLALAVALSLLAAAPARAELAVERLGTYQTGLAFKDAAEIVAHDPKNQRLLVVNGADKTIDVLDFRDPRAMRKLAAWPLAANGGAAASVAIHGDRVAVAVPNENKQAAGRILLFDLDGERLAAFKTGALPDMVTFTPDGAYVLSADEGEPSADFKTDPKGSVTIVDLRTNAAKTVAFDTLRKSDLGPAAHFPSPAGTSLAQDLEPEYIAVAPDGKTAFVICQENNLVVVIDIPAAEIRGAFSLGVQNWHALEFDASDKDGGVNRAAWPVVSLRQPDAAAAFQANGTTYLVTANEGDARDYDGYSEETRVAKLTLDPAAYPDAEALQKNSALGRLKATTAKGDTDGDGDIDQIHAFGGRSFSIFDATGALIFDSADQFSAILSKAHPSWFNSNGSAASFDQRSDDKGVEPEGLALGEVNGVPYAFIGLERMGGVMVYDLSDPTAPKFTAFLHNARPEGDPEKGTAGDVGPEGLLFIPAAQSPTGAAILVVANEVSGSTTAYELK